MRATVAALATAVLATAALAGCTPAAPQGTPGAPAGDSASAAPVTVVAGTRPAEQLLAHVAVRHLSQRGVPAVLGEPTASPWEAAEDRQVAVVDSLAMAAEVAPAALAGPVPTPSPSPAASGAGSGAPTGPAGPTGTAGTGSPAATATASASPPGSSAPPSDPAPASPAGHPTATGSPSPLPEGVPAADAVGTGAIVAGYLPSGAEVLGESEGTLRLQAVTTTATAGLYGMEDVRDLNGLCDRMAFTPRDTGTLEAERLEVLAGCEPARWTRPGPDGPAADLVAGRADVALLYGTDPAIADHALVPLADPQRILPEGRVLLVGPGQSLPGDATAALADLAGSLGGEQLAELQRLVTGPDVLPAPEAAQYWLVSAGLEPAPEDWF